MASRMSRRERKFLADRDRRNFRYREFTPGNLAMDLERKFDIEFRGGPLWELDFIFSLHRPYKAFELKDDDVPDWIEIEILGEEGRLKPKLKWVWHRSELHFVCEYIPGGTKALKRRWIKIRIKIEGEPDREIECKLEKWRKRK